jgi:hypothetical protein
MEGFAMATLLLELRLQRKNDLVQIRRIVRQATALLGFDGSAQTCLAAAAFDLSYQSLHSTGVAKVRLEIEGATFLATWTPLDAVGAPAAGAKLWRLTRPLPNSSNLAQADASWILAQLANAAPVDLFEELQRVNTELLQALLAAAQAQKGQQAEAAEINAA